MTTIGCEPLCGRCDDCEWLVAALRVRCSFDRLRMAYVAGASANLAYAQATNAIDAAGALAGLLSRALRSRGVTDADGSTMDGHVILSLPKRVKSGGADWSAPELSNEEARAVLARLMALPLNCGRESAAAALRGAQ